MAENPGMRINCSFDRPAKELINKYKNIPAANVDDCMGRLFAMDAGIKAVGMGKRLLGTAFTVKAAIADNMMFHKALTLARPGDVIVMNACGDLNYSVCGDLTFKYAMSKGIAGIVIDGCVRDVDFLKSVDFPVYARGVTPRGPYKNGPGEINTDIACGGQAVHPGDIIIGDEDGIVVLRKGDAEIVYEKVQKLMANEIRLEQAIKEGKWEEMPVVTAVNEKIIANGFEVNP